LDEKLAKAEENAVVNSAAAEERAKVRNDRASLREAYALAVNGIGGLCSPINNASSSAYGFFRWFESEVALLLEFFVGTNENSLSIALEGVLQMVKAQNAVDFDVLHTVASTCGTTIFCLLLVK
jgi:hypothetical protein